MFEAKTKNRKPKVEKGYVLLISKVLSSFLGSKKYHEDKAKSNDYKVKETLYCSSETHYILLDK